MAALNWNDLSETPPNAVNWDELSDTPPKETSVPERVVNTGQALGRLAKDLPTHSLAYAANIKEGSRPLDKNDWADKATEDSSKLLNERLSASDANDKTLLGTKGDWAQTGASIPFSMGSIPAAIGAGGLATVVTKNPIAGYSAGATASGALAYRADSAMFMNSALNTFKDKYKAENNGVEPSQELMLAEQERLQPYAEDHGLWEAIPEGLGSAIGGKVVSSAFKNAGENLAVKAGKVIAGLAAEEMPSETVSQQGQYNTEIDAGVSEGEKRSFTSPSDIAQSVSEVAIPVAQQSLLMGGAAGVTSKAYDYAKERARKLQETAKTGTLGRSIAAGDIAATDTVIQPDIEEKYAAPKANPAEQIENVDTEPAFEKRNSPYNDLFDAATIKHNLPDGLLNKIGHVESGFNPDAISPAGARGVMQFMPRTANEYGIDPHDTPAAIDAAGKKMAHLRDYYDGNITKAIAAYNYGEGNLNKVIDNHGDQWREHLPTETTNYLNKIIGGSNESKSSRVDSGSRSTNDALATTVNKIKEEEPDYSSLSLDELENLHKKAIDANNDIDYEAIKKHLGEDEADNFLKLSERQKGNWWEKNADTAMEDDSSAFHGIDSDKILAHINAKNDFDIESPESLGRSIAFKMMNISSPDFKGSPDYTAIKSALEYAQDKGWDTQKIIKSARNKATEIAGADAPELFDTLFKKVENKANSEPIIKEQSKAIADQVTPIQLKENKLKSANDEKVEVKYGKNTFHVLKSELDSDAPILDAFNVKSGKQASFKLKRDKIELKDDQPTTITGNDAANGSDAERANGATDTGGAAQESNKGLTNPAQAATQPTETINGSKESTNEKRSLPTQEQERPLLNNEAPVQSGALSSGEFNPILKTKKTTWVKNRLKELQVKEGTAGYAKRLKEVQAEHANELEKAQASLPYEQFKALPDNEGIPDSLVRQAYDVLREDHGITTPIDTQAHESATSPNNDLPAPTPAQIEAGNYKKGHINLHGLDISIENPKGSTRSGTDKDGTPWENTMTSHYGYIKGSIGADKEHVDVFVGDNYGSDKAFVVNQNHPHNGKFDEHKVMLGFDTAEQAKEGYLKNYVDGWKGLGSITEIPVSELKDRIKSGALTKPIANSIAKTDESNGVSNKNDQFGEADLPKFIQNIDKHRRDLFGVDDHINKANTLLPFTESTIGDHPSIEHAVDFLNRRTDAYKHFDGRLLKGGSASQSLSLKDDLLPNWSQAKQIERSFEEWKKKYPRQAQKLKENQQNVLNLNKGDKVLFPNHGAKEGDPVHDTGEILKKNPKNWIIKSKNGVELHFQPSALKPVSGNYNSHIENAIEPVVEDSQVDNSRLEKKSDQKPETKQYHPAIESLSNDLVEGGGVSLIHNEHGTIIGRTPSLNPDWFKDGRFQIYKPDGAPYSSTPSVREVKQAVSDYKAGNKLKAKQVAILESLHDHLVSEEEANSNKKEEDLIYNHLEKEIESGNLTIDDVEEALDEFDNGVPFDVKGGNISINELEDWLGISNEKEESTGSTDKAQGEILQNYSESELAKHEREQADRARKSAEAEVKANQSNYGKANKVFTEGAANAARERLKAKLGRLNSGFDPEMMLDGMTLAGYHIEAGAKQYGVYAKAMIADLGEGIKPYLAHFYNAVRDYPGFDNKDMASYASLEASKKIGVYPGENWRYKNQQAREVTQVNEHYITFATRDNDGRDQESISNFIASKKDWSQTDNTHGQADNDYVKNGSNPQETHHDHSEANNTGTTENITRDSSEAPIESGVSNSQSKKPNQNGTRQSKSRVRTRQGQYDSTDLNQSEGNGLLSEHEGLVGHETNESIERSIGGQTSADTGVSKSIGADNYSLLNKKPIALTPAKRRDVNILAEEILKKPVNEITEDDKNILRQYTGNGGLDLKASADKGEAIFNQHYSAYDTIKAMYGALMDAGIKMVNNLEPSVGSGNFIGMHPRANWTSVDIDKTNTEIVKRLYPDAKVFHESYETFRGKNYDLIISNVPFASFSSLAREHAGTIKPMFKAIHNFFFAQSIDKLKTGGVMAFMTSTGTMDGIGEGQRLRQHLVKRMDVIGAYRLPMGTQKANASTEVMIDVIFLQKRPEGVESKQPEKNNAFVNVTNKGGYKINQYFADYPESVLGELSVGANKTSMGKVGWIVTGDADYSRMKVEPQDYASTKKATQDRFAGPEEAAQYAEKQGLKFIDGKTTPFFKDGFVYDQPATYSEFSGGGLFGRKATGVNADKMAALQKIEETTDSDLVRSYENKYGKPPHTDKLLELWAKTNHAAKQLKAYLSLFDKHFNLSEIFTKKVRFENSGKIEINENSPLYDRAESLEDADGIFSTKNNLLSDDEMQGLLDSNDYAKLSNGHFQNARLYYAGNIYQKLDDVQKVKPAAQRDKQIARLERVKPTLILIKDLTITGKEKWMPDSAIAAIGKQTYQDGTVIIGDRAIDNTYFLQLFNQYLNNEPLVKKRQSDTPEEYAEQLKAAQNTLYSEVLPLIKQKLMDEGLSDEVVNAYNRAKNFFAPPSFDGSSLRNLPETFRGKPFKLMRHQLEGAERAIYNKKGVLAFSPGLGKTPTAIVVADQLLQKGVMKKPLFIVPANTIPQWEATTRDLYPNAKVYEFPKYTSGINKGKPKDWPSMSAADKEKMVHDLTNNQYDYTFISTNLAQKITIPTDKLSQYVDDLAESISSMEKPDEELNKSQLKAKATRLAKIKMLKATIMASYAESNKNGFDMGKMGFDALFADEVQYYKNIGMQSEEAKGGIGANVAINAKYPLVEDEKGKLVQDKTQDPISVSLGSSRSYDFRFKTQFISEKNNGNNIFLLTGTPTPNKPLELMTLLHHLDIHILDEYGIDNVGDFVNEFLDVQEVEEIGVDGSAKLKPQLVSLQNIFGLKKIITRFIDYRSPESATDLTRPKQKDVTHIILQNEASEAIFADVQERILKSIEDANEKRSGNIVEAEQMIAMYSAGRDASVDVRLYTPSKIGKGSIAEGTVFKKETRSQYSKIAKTVELVAAKNKQDPEAGQLIFLDRLKFSDGSGSTHEDIRNDILEATGLSPQEVVFVNGGEYVNPKTGKIAKNIKPEMLQTIMDDYNAGKIKVLIGNTSKLGVGVDLQTTTTDIYQLDKPYRPDEIEQRNNRGVRQGNRNAEVTVHTFNQPGTFDAMSDRIIASKQGFNDVFWKDQTSDKADVKGEEAPGHYDAAIELERDPVRKRKLEIERDLSQASAKTNNLEKQVSNLAKRIKSVTESKTQYENANQGIDTREAPKYEDQTDAERKKSLAAWKQRQADQRALNVKRIGDLTEDLKTLEESKAQRIEELEAHKAHIASIRNQYVVNGVVNLDAIKNGGNQDVVLFSKSTETPSNTHTKQSLSSAIKSIMDKAFGDGWTNRLLSTDKFKIISRDEAVSIAGEKASDAKGFYDPKTDTTFLVADNISQNTTPEEIEGLLYHEIASHALKLGKSSAEFKSILARFEKLKAIDANIQAAFDRVPKDTNPEHVTEEALSYYLEKNPRSTLGKRVIEWFRQAIRAIGNTLVGKDKYLFSKWANELTHTELVNMANKALKSAHDSLLFDNVGRENEAVKISQSAMKSVEANIKRGREAMTNALLNKSTVHRAMFRQGMGWVDFVWGDAGGSITSKGKRPGAKGISHIIEARQRKDGLSNQQAEKMLFDLVDTIAKGQEVNRYESALSTSIKINYHDNQVLLARRNGSNAWIVTGFEIHEPVDVGSGYDAPTPTQSTSTLTRNELGAGEETIAQDNGKSNDNDIKFSKFEPSVGEHYTLPAETKPRHQQRLWQDMNNRWTVIQDVIKKAGGVINDANNVYQAMELMPSKAGERIRDYRDTYITPLYDRMTKAGVTLNDLALFNYATHAEERNLAMSKINPRFSIDNGSGMTNQEAIDTLEELKLHYGSRFGELEKLAKEFRAITDDTLNILVDAGVMTQDAVDKMRATYQNYVPLKGFEKVDENGNQTNGAGLGHSTGKAFSQRALGRESKAGQIIENIIRDHERAIVWAEKTEVAKTLGNFVQDFPDDKLWTLQKISLKPTLTPGKREFFLFYSGSFVGKAKTAKDMRRFRDAEIARTGQDKKDYRINVIKADDKVGARPEPFDPEKEARYIQYGKEVRIQIHDLLALKAFNKLGDQSENEIFRLAGVMNSFLRQMWTQKNPAFFLINPIRDVQTASIYLTGEGGVTLAGKAIKNLSSSWFTMWNHVRNKQSSPTEQAILDRYRKSGGMVGTAYISSLDKINEDIHHQLQRFGGEQIQDLISAGKIREAVSSIGFRVLNNKLFDGIENLNTAFECATRLATFKAAVESGYTDKQAAALALNVTVNFTKKGEYGRELGAMYLFANANIQGNANVFKTLTQSNYRGQAWAIAGSLAVLGFMAAMAGGDDGEDELIGDYEKERNLIFDLGEGKRFTIPVAYGWSIFMDLGRAMARAMNGGDTEAISKKLASSFLGNFSPIGNPIPNGELSADNAIVAFAPTFSKPFVMPAVNKTSFGTPLMPESPFKPNQPDSEKVYRKTRGTLYDSAAETLNSVTGGDAVQSGWIDVSPETLKNTWNYLLGGAGRFITDTESMAQTALSVNEESKPESWPIVKTFYKSESIDDYRRRYYEQADRIVKANEQFSAYKKAGEIDKAKEMIRDNGNLIRLKVYSSGVRDKLKAIRDKEDEIRKAGGDIRLLNALESRERKILSDFSAIAAR